ncbi:MAG TPA: class I SAM-dependent methyltransferase, partial [Pyrinomonadaceae bacterium]|nr:class I SAM-dependent methyltransferase [Pyrinomonadaceae bacterium]
MAVYDSLAKFYDKAFAPLERLGLRRLRKRAFAYLPPYERVLEIGAGTGANFTFYQHSAFALSTELSIEMLRLAKEKQKGNHLVCCNAEALPFADESFDAVAATLVFCSIGKPLQALAEIKRVCRGGKLVLIEHVRPTGLLGSFFDLLSKVTVALIEDHFNRKTA